MPHVLTAEQQSAWWLQCGGVDPESATAAAADGFEATPHEIVATTGTPATGYQRHTSQKGVDGRWHTCTVSDARRLKLARHRSHLAIVSPAGALPRRARARGAGRPAHRRGGGKSASRGDPDPSGDDPAPGERARRHLQLVKTPAAKPATYAFGFREPVA